MSRKLIEAYMVNPKQQKRYEKRLIKTKHWMFSDKAKPVK